VDHQVHALRLDVEELAMPLHVVDRQPDEGRNRRVVRLQGADRGDVGTGEGVRDRAIPQERGQRLDLRQLGHPAIVPCPTDRSRTCQGQPRRSPGFGRFG
jgi:hypothetical protein